MDNLGNILFITFVIIAVYSLWKIVHENKKRSQSRNKSFR